MTPIEYARNENRAATERLVDYLRIASVSAVPERKGDMRLAADWTAQRLVEAGATDVRIDDTDGHPVVFGQRLSSPGAPTVLVYGHYDVQPPDPEEEWITPAFEPDIRDGAIYARGASDDKGQVLIHLEALDAYTKTVGSPPVNLKYVIEGEEEIGSPSLDQWLRDHAQELDADVAVISDTAMLGPKTPSMVYGLRGLAYVEVEVVGPKRDLHSGQFGGAVLNPAHALCNMVAALHDGAGRITIPGFYDSVRSLSTEERQLLASIPFDDDAYENHTGAAGNWGEEGYTRIERLGARPTLDVNGIWSGWTGSGAKTVLPSVATAKISMRLVPDQDPHEVTRACSEYLVSLAPEGVDVKVTPLHGASPAIVDRELPAVQAAAKGYEEAFGREPVFTREGGTIPVVASLQTELGLPSILMGFGLPDDNLHAPNEKFRVENFTKGIEAVIVFLDALSKEKS
jgi:acetylornithine deacetylase/succinyl-diaminopimelate desuccinylase-like protein